MNKIPYFEMKVVKVKKAECKHDEVIWAKRNFKCKCCGRNLRIQTYTNIVSDRKWTFIKDEEQRNGNWVNGENLDKIKFPCFCRFDRDGLGMIVKTLMYNPTKEMYTLYDICRQAVTCVNSVQSFEDIGDLIKGHDIHILKGKIIIFEKEE